MTHPKLFISYSWSNPDHEQRVLNLASELCNSGIDVILDKWDLKEGNDAYFFMEKMVTDHEIKKVACIVDKVYAEKANLRKGGVGTEAQIISQELYNKTEQSKFVAVVLEKDEQGNAYLPVYLKSRLYIDLSNEGNYSENFELLLRWVFDKPLHVKPEIGKRPAFLDANPVTQLATNVLYSRALEAIRQHKANAIGTVNEYFETFAHNLERFRLERQEGIEFDEQVIKNIDEFLPYRNEFIQLIIALCHFPIVEAEEALHKFFEKLMPYLFRGIGLNSYNERDFENFKFIIHELFLYAIGITLKHERFKMTQALIQSEYYIGDLNQYSDEVMVPYAVFRDHLEILEYRNKRLNLSRLSLHADLLKERSAASGIDFKYLMQADFLLYIRAEITKCGLWWPETLLYLNRQQDKPFELFAKASSKKYFEKIKQLISINTPEDLIPLFDSYRTNKRQVPSWHIFRLDPHALLGASALAQKD